MTAWCDEQAEIIKAKPTNWVYRQHVFISPHCEKSVNPKSGNARYTFACLLLATILHAAKEQASPVWGMPAKKGMAADVDISDQKIQSLTIKLDT